MFLLATLLPVILTFSGRTHEQLIERVSRQWILATHDTLTSSINASYSQLKAVANLSLRLGLPFASEQSRREYLQLFSTSSLLPASALEQGAGGFKVTACRFLDASIVISFFNEGVARTQLHLDPAGFFNATEFALRGRYVDPPQNVTSLVINTTTLEVLPGPDDDDVMVFNAATYVRGPDWNVSGEIVRGLPYSYVPPGMIRFGDYVQPSFGFSTAAFGPVVPGVEGGEEEQKAFCFSPLRGGHFGWLLERTIGAEALAAGVQAFVVDAAGGYVLARTGGSPLTQVAEPYNSSIPEHVRLLQQSNCRNVIGTIACWRNLTDAPEYHLLRLVMMKRKPGIGDGDGGGREGGWNFNDFNAALAVNPNELRTMIVEDDSDGDNMRYQASSIVLRTEYRGFNHFQLVIFVPVDFLRGPVYTARNAAIGVAIAIVVVCCLLAYFALRVVSSVVRDLCKRMSNPWQLERRPRKNGKNQQTPSSSSADSSFEMQHASNGSGSDSSSSCRELFLLDFAELCHLEDEFFTFSHHIALLRGFMNLSGGGGGKHTHRTSGRGSSSTSDTAGDPKQQEQKQQQQQQEKANRNDAKITKRCITTTTATTTTTSSDEPRTKRVSFAVTSSNSNNHDKSSEDVLEVVVFDNDSSDASSEDSRRNTDNDDDDAAEENNNNNNGSTTGSPPSHLRGKEKNQRNFQRASLQPGLAPGFVLLGAVCIEFPFVVDLANAIREGNFVPLRNNNNNNESSLESLSDVAFPTTTPADSGGGQQQPQHSTAAPSSAVFAQQHTPAQNRALNDLLTVTRTIAQLCHSLLETQPISPVEFCGGDCLIVTFHVKSLWKKSRILIRLIQIIFQMTDRLQRVSLDHSYPMFKAGSAVLVTAGIHVSSARAVRTSQAVDDSNSNSNSGSTENSGLLNLSSSQQQSRNSSSKKKVRVSSSSTSSGEEEEDDSSNSKNNNSSSSGDAASSVPGRSAHFLGPAVTGACRVARVLAEQAPRVIRAPVDLTHLATQQPFEHAIVGAPDEQSFAMDFTQSGARRAQQRSNNKTENKRRKVLVIGLNQQQNKQQQQQQQARGVNSDGGGSSLADAGTVPPSNAAGSADDDEELGLVRSSCLHAIGMPRVLLPLLGSLQNSPLLPLASPMRARVPMPLITEEEKNRGEVNADFVLTRIVPMPNCF